MKRLLLLSLLFISTSVLSSDLSIRLRNGSAFIVQFNSTYYNNPVTQFDLTNVSEGYHYLQVFKVYDDGHTRLLFKGHIKIPANSFVKAIVEKDRRLKVTTETVIPGTGSTNSGGNNPGNSTGSPNTPSSPVVMSEGEFKELKESLEKISFSATKLSTAKTTLEKKYVNSSQVAELVKLFVFESDKIELAKFCYDITVDKQRYYLVNDSFSFASSIEELNQYIKSKN